MSAGRKWDIKPSWLNFPDIFKTEDRQYGKANTVNWENDSPEYKLGFEDGRRDAFRELKNMLEDKQ